MAIADTSLQERRSRAGGEGRLARGVLSDVDIAAATLADMAPTMSFFFGFATIVTAAGIAAPLTVIAAAIAIGLLGNTLSQFSRSRPSTGSFVTFIGSAFGGYSAVVTAVVLCAGYIIAVASVVTISGGLAETILKQYLSITIPWQAISAVLSLGALALIVTGAKPSTKVAAVLFMFQVLLLLVVAIALLVEHSGYINAQPFDPSRLHAAALTNAQIPFIAAAGTVASGLVFIAYIAGFTSICSCLISATNSQARIIFNSGREGLLPSVTARLTERRKTPWVAFSVYLALALGLSYVFGWNTDPVTFFGEIATMGTILIAITYLVVNLALPVYYYRHERERFSNVKHVLLPLLGAAAIGYPLYELVKPGQPARLIATR